MEKNVKVLGALASLLVIQSHGMQQESIVQHLEKLAKCYDRGVGLGKNFACQLTGYKDLTEENNECMGMYTRTLNELKNSTAGKELNGEWQKSLMSYVHVFSNGFIEAIGQSRFERLVADCEIICSSKKVLAAKIIMNYKIIIYKIFYNAMLSLGSIKSLAHLDYVEKSYAEEELSSNRNKMTQLLGYYFEFGQRYAKGLMPALLDVENTGRRNETKPLRLEFDNTCATLMDNLISSAFPSKKYVEAWVCLHAFSKGVMSALEIADLDNHFEYIDKEQAKKPSTKTRVQARESYKAKLTMFARFADPKKERKQLACTEKEFRQNVIFADNPMGMNEAPDILDEYLDKMQAVLDNGKR